MLNKYYPELTVTRGDAEDEEDFVINPVVDYYYTPGTLGRRERGSGLALEPDEEGSVEIISITLDGEPLILSAEEFSGLEQEIWESEQ